MISTLARDAVVPVDSVGCGQWFWPGHRQLEIPSRVFTFKTFFMRLITPLCDFRPIERPDYSSPRHHWHQTPDAHEVVGRHHPEEVLPHSHQPPELRLPEPANLLSPAQPSPAQPSQRVPPPVCARAG